MDQDQPAHPRRFMDAQAGLDPCWPQNRYVGFVMARLICTSVNEFRS
jgi:hypothetical protein